VEAYSQKSKIEIGDTVLRKHRIYLDMKYCIFLRDASLGKASPAQTKIYEKLETLVENEIAICPLSPHIFKELMKIGDEQKRMSTAQVMDELSHQVCFISQLDIAGQELLSFVRYYQAKAKERFLFNPAKYVFTKVAFVLGELYLSVEGIPTEHMNDIRIQFFDHLSKFTLVEMLKTMKSDLPLRNSENFISQLNKEKDDNQDWKSFHEVFMHEIGGILDAVRDDLEELCIYLRKNDVGGSVPIEETYESESAELLSKAIYNAFDQKKINKELPYFHINASLHAFIRYNKGQHYDENDLIDFSHVAWALPYCDMFFTEKPLHNWICSKLLKLDKIYGTKVFCREEDVLDTLNPL
jgi:hypothetical protein